MEIMSGKWNIVSIYSQTVITTTTSSIDLLLENFFNFTFIHLWESSYNLNKYNSTFKCFAVIFCYVLLYMLVSVLKLETLICE